MYRTATVPLIFWSDIDSGDDVGPIRWCSINRWHWINQGSAGSMSSYGSDGVECCGCLAGNSGEPRDLNKGYLTWKNIFWDKYAKM